MKQSLILLIEGKSSNHTSLIPALEKAGFALKHVTSGLAARNWVAQANPSPHLIIFDASTLRSNGVRNCQQLRQHLPGIPLIYIRSANQKVSAELETEAHLVHPFTPRKVLNRVRAMLPPDLHEEQIVHYGHIKLYVDRGMVEVNGRGEKHITPKLSQLLAEFLRHPNEMISRAQLMQNVWQTSYVGDTRTLDVHVRWVRELIEQDPSQPRLLQTVRGKGYILRINWLGNG